MKNQYEVGQEELPAATDIVEIDGLAVNAHGQLWSLLLLGSFLLAPDIANRVRAAVSFAAQRPGECSEHIWLLNIKCGSHC